MKPFIVAIFSFVNLGLMAVPASRHPFKVVQPNGDTITVIHKGDEYASWYEIADNGRVIAKDTTVNGSWRYVVANAGKLELSALVKKADISTDSTELTASIGDNKKLIMEIFKRQRETALAYQSSIANSVNMDDSITAKYIEKYGLPIQTKSLNTSLPTTGKVKILTILVQFKDVKFQNPAEVKQCFTNIMNQKYYRAPGSDEITGSVRDFYLDASYGQLDIESTVVGPYTVNAKRAYFGRNGNRKDVNAGNLVYRAVVKAARDVNMQDFNNTDDKSVECVHVVFAGNGEGENGGPEDAIFPHQGSISGIVKDGVWISRYIITPELLYDNYDNIGTICHELGHILGAPDFYDMDYYNSGGLYDGTGDWDLMASGSWNGHAINYNGGVYDVGDMPAHPNPYVKTQLFGWAQAQELTGNNTVYTLEPSELNSDCIHKVSTPDGGYYLLENRQQKYLPGHGLVIYHVHPNIANSSAGELLKDNNINVGHPQKCYMVNAYSPSEIPSGNPGSYGEINEQNAAYPGYPTTPTIFFTSTSTPSNVGWDGQYPQNKDVAFIHEDGKNIKFVFNPSISGSSTLCEQETYSIPDVHSMIPDAEIEWKYSGIIMSDLPPFLIIGEQGRDSITYRRGVYFNPLLGDYSQYTGIWDIMATVSYVGNEYTMQKKVTMPMQQDLRIQCDDNDGITPIQYFGGATVHLSLREPSDNPSHIKWVCDFDFDDNLEGIPPGSHYTETYYGNSVAIPTYPTFGGTLTVSVYDIGDECNPDRHETWSHHFIPTIIYIDHTNPASGSVDISLSRVAAEGTDGTTVLSAATAQKEPYMGAYCLELWHDHYGLVRSIDSDGNCPTLTLDLHGLTPGIYYIRLLIDGEINSVSKLMVR